MDKPRFNITPGDTFDSIPPVSKVITEYVDSPGADRDLDEAIKKARLDYSKPVPKPPEVLTVNGISWGTMGDFSFIYGKAKSKKTFCTSIAISASVGGSWGMFKSKLPKDKPKVVFFDTEQSDYDVYLVANRITRMMGHEGLHPNLDIIRLRGNSPEQTQAIIGHYLKTTPGIGLVVIDGIREFVYDINSQDESTKVQGLLLKWTQEYGFHIITVLHENKNTPNPRGALGTELINKCCTAIQITVDPKDKAVSIVEPQETRQLPFKPFAFTVDSKGLPEVVEGWEPTKGTEAGRKRTPGADELEPFKVFELLSALKRLVGDTKPKLSEIYDLMGIAYREKFGEDLPKTHERGYTTYFKGKGNLVVHGAPGTRHSWYEIAVPESPAKPQEPDPQTNLGLRDNTHNQTPF
jgi:hypothetical protein